LVKFTHHSDAESYQEVASVFYYHNALLQTSTESNLSRRRTAEAVDELIAGLTLTEAVDTDTEP